MFVQSMGAPLYRIVLLGDGGVGKSALTIQLTGNYFVVDYDPTIENSYRKQLLLPDGSSHLLDILDTAGQEDYSAMRDQYIRTGAGFILVYSVDSKIAFEAIPAIRERILRVKEETSFPMVLAGNKCDLTNRAVSYSDGATLAKSWGIPFLETSAKNRINVEELFRAIVLEVKKARESSSAIAEATQANVATTTAATQRPPEDKENKDDKQKKDKTEKQCRCLPWM